MTESKASRILVIDDEITQRMLMKEYLEEAGYQVRLSEDGRHGLKMASTVNVDLIIVDAILPSLDGYSLCTQLRQSPKTTNVPIILITASKEPNAIAKGLAAGATDFITKPVEWQFLADRIAYVLERSRQMIRLEAENNLMSVELRDSQRRDERRAHLVQNELESATQALAREVQTISAAAEERVRKASDEIESRVAAMRDDYDRQLEQARGRFEQDARSVRAEADDKVRKAQIAASTLLDAGRKTAEQQIRSIKATAEAETLDAKAHFAAQLQQVHREAVEQIGRLQAELAKARGTPVVAAMPTDRQPPPELRNATIWAFIAAASREQLKIARRIYEAGQAGDKAVADEGDARRGLGYLKTAGTEAAALMAAMKNYHVLAETMAGDNAQSEGNFALANQLETVATRVGPLCAERGVTVDVQLEDDTIELAADESRLRYAVLGLLLNAIRFSVPGGKIRIRAERESSGDMRLAILDSGVGIPPAQLERLQRCLEAPEGLIDPRHGNVGLGIPVASAIARSHGGRFNLESALGLGTTASITLPAARVLPAGQASFAARR